MSRKTITGIWFVLSVFTGLGVRAQFEGVQGVIQRRVPWLAGKVLFRHIDGVNGYDRFILSGRVGGVLIEANNENAAATGLNHYLTYYCHRSMSHAGDNLSPVSPLPLVRVPDTVIASAQIRQALNYCTYNYTMSFYSWKDWEHELDWMALNGVNLMLVAGGAEVVWRDVLQRLGYESQDIARYITGPAFNAWWLMGNIQGWGGPMSQEQMEARMRLTQRMLVRMRSLGIAPIMPAFYGMVPSDLRQRLGAKVFVQGTWGAYTRPDILDPADPLFDKIAGLFYESTGRYYGSDLHYFSGDPFHEGGQTAGADIGKVGAAIQRNMQRSFPGSVWVLQGWQDNPKKDLLSSLDRSSVLVQELFGENTSNWENRKGYEGTPFIWCTVTNFGERPGLSGKLQRFADEVNRALNSPYSAYMKGVGIMPEGIENNPVVYACMMELGWGRKHIDIDQWIEGYIAARYGASDPRLSAAWKLLVQTIYSSTLGYQEGPPENILCARPALSIRSVSSWGTIRKKYDEILFDSAVRIFEQAGTRFSGNLCYRLDLINFRRQVISNRADSVYAGVVRAYERKDFRAFELVCGQFLRMIDTTDRLLNREPYYTLDRWRRAALAVGSEPGERRNNLFNAMMLITYWGADDRKEDNLHDYAYKEWGGMMKSFYKQRWVMYFDWLKKRLKGDSLSAAPDFFAFERNWVSQQLGELRVGVGTADRRYTSYDVVPTDSIWRAVIWKGDQAATQVLIGGGPAISNLRVVCSGLRRVGGGEIGSAQVRYGFMRYVLTDGLPKEGGGCGLPAWVQADSSLVADRISSEVMSDVAAGATQAIWVSVSTPHAIPAGEYTGTLLVSGKAGGVSFVRKVLCRIEVQAHDLPDASRWRYHLDLWQNPYSIARVHGLAVWSPAHFAAMRPYMRLLAEGGQKTITVSMIYDPWRGQTYDVYGSMIKWIKLKDGRWSYDYSIFDEWVAFMQKQGIDGLINCYTMVSWNNKYYYYDEASGRDSVLTAAPGSLEYDEHWRSMLTDFRRHLLGKGWYARTSIAMDERALADMERVIRLVKSVDTAWKISLAGSYHPEISDDIYDYCIASAEHFDAVTLGRRLAAGWPTTYYTCCVERMPNTFSFSPPAESEWLAWYALAHRFNGYLRWAYNCWPARPLVDSRFSSWPAGDTYLVYPGAERSIRFEKMVQGIREYEKLRILEDAFRAGGDAGKLQRLQDVLAGFEINALGRQAADKQLLDARGELEALGR